MRDVDTVQEIRIELERLEEAWTRLNRPTISRELRDSLWTRLSDLRGDMTSAERRARAADRERWADRREQAAALARAGAGVDEIAARTGYSRTSVSTILSRARSRGRQVPELWKRSTRPAAAVRLAADGLTDEEIAVATGYTIGSVPVVLTAMRRSGAVVPGRAERRRTAAGSGRPSS